MCVCVSVCVCVSHRDAASKLLEDGSAVEILARALAKITGYKEMKARSLLTAHDDYTTLLFTSSSEIQYLGAVWGYLKYVIRTHETHTHTWTHVRFSPNHAYPYASHVCKFCGFKKAGGGGISGCATDVCVCVCVCVFTCRKVCKIPDASCEAVKRMTLTADSKGAVFDVPSEQVDEFLAAAGVRRDTHTHRHTHARACTHTRTSTQTDTLPQF